VGCANVELKAIDILDFLGLHDQSWCGDWLYIADIQSSLFNRRHFILVYYAIGGQKQILRSPIQIWPFTVLFSLVQLLSKYPVYFLPCSSVGLPYGLRSVYMYKCLSELVLRFHAFTGSDTSLSLWIVQWKVSGRWVDAQFDSDPSPPHNTSIGREIDSTKKKWYEYSATHGHSQHRP
jgi:hypothetical protein